MSYSHRRAHPGRTDNTDGKLVSKTVSFARRTSYTQTSHTTGSSNPHRRRSARFRRCGTALRRVPWPGPPPFRRGSRVPLSTLAVRNVQLSRNSGHYNLLLRICELVLNSLQPEEHGRAQDAQAFSTTKNRCLQSLSHSSGIYIGSEQNEFSAEPRGIAVGVTVSRNCTKSAALFTRQCGPISR